MKVAVVGAGVVGITSAYYLARHGWDVTLIDGRERPAEVASYANGGQLSYSYVAPLSGPGVLASLPSLLFRHDSPLRFRLRMDMWQWRWCLQFAAACRASIAAATTARLLELANLSRDALHGILRERDLEFNYRRSGKLVVYRTPELFERARALVEYQAAHGARQRLLRRSEILALEPSLDVVGEQLVGGVFTEADETGDCHLFARSVLERAREMPGFRLMLGNRVRSLRKRAGRIVALDTMNGDLDVDAVVIAAGLCSRGLLAAVGHRVPLYPLKGYSLSVPLSGIDGVPSAGVTDYERRIVYARIGNVLRVAAMVDIGAADAGVEHDRIELLKRQVTETFPRLDLAGASAWAGFRPATPDGRPRIGRSRTAENLWLNVGHGSLGFTLSCGSAMLLASEMSGLEPPIDPAAFQP